MTAKLDHRFGAALLASVALHGIVMALSVPQPRPIAVAAPLTLDVTLAESSPPATSTAREKLAAAVATAVPAPSSPSPPPSPLPSSAPPATAVPVEPAAVPSAPAQPAPPAPAPAAPRPSRELLAEYGNTISVTLARYRTYPRIAQLRGWQGDVTMELRVSTSGGMLEARVQTSSGYGVLDDQALEMAARATPFPPPPEGLRDGDIDVLVPVVFRLTP